MCGRYTLTRPGELLNELSVEPPSEGLEPRYNIAPTQNAPTVRTRRDDDSRELVQLRWGLVPFWAKDLAIGNRMINARSESVAEKPSFKSALRSRRCLVLTDGFYEWKKMPAGKQPYHIHFPERRPFAVAGLWDRWKGDPSGPIESFTILTTQANDTIAELHNRMPVILGPEAWDLWLDRGVEDSDRLCQLLVPYAGADLLLTPVNRRVNSPRNDGPECLEPLRTMPAEPPPSGGDQGMLF